MIDRREFLRLGATAAGAAVGPPWLAGCTRRPRRPRLVIVYATCSVNADHLAPYNTAVRYTPGLARFAAQGAALHRHQTECGQSGIAYASIFTGLQADRHGIYDHPRNLDASVRQVTEVFADGGYDVFFWGGHGMASYDLGYGRGTPAANHRPRLLTADDDLFVEVVERVRRDPSYRALVLTNFTVTHMKYTLNPAYFGDEHRSPATLPGEFARLAMSDREFRDYRELFFTGASDFDLCGDLHGTIARWGLGEAEAASFRRVVEYLYRCAIYRLDTLFGSVVARIDGAGLAADSAVVFTADHGETLHRDNTFLKYAHGYQLAPEVLRVPFLVRAAGAGVNPAGHGFVSRSVDLLPTVAGLCGLWPEGDPVTEGVDLSPVLTGRGPAPVVEARSHTALVHTAIAEDPEYRGSLLYRLFPGRDPEHMWVCVRTGDKVAKLAKVSAEGPIEPALFDLGADPEERRNLFDAGDPDHLRLVTGLEAYKRRLVAAYLRKPPDDDTGLREDERLQRLRALGYI